MPISPYSAPIQYEYKPLNLSAFAAPLSEMQQKFDIVTEAVDAADFTLANLPYGTDPERAKELIKIVKSKRDELAKNLGETKNYKQAASKLRELNNLWTKDPELNALQANAKLWAERDKAELARVGKGADAGGITRDQYLQWKDREIRKYDKENKGAGFKASAADPTGTYNVITGSTGRLTDLAKDLEELSWKVANANPAQKWDTFREAGIDPELMDKKFVKTITEEKDANKIAQVTSEYLKTLPRFKDWATEVADYNFDALEQNPENYKAVASDLNTKYLSSLNYQINKLEKDSKKDKKILESAEYKDLLEEKAKAEQAGTTGKYDPTATKNLFTHQHLNDVYDMGALGKVLAYKNVTHDYTFRALPVEDAGGAGAGGAGATGEGFFIPSAKEDWNITSLNKQKVNSGKNLYKTVGDINNLEKGNVRIAIMGDRNSKQYKELIKHPDQIRARQEQLLATLTQTIQSGGDWQKFQTAANKKGIVMSDNNARTLWGGLTKNGNQGISDFAAHIKSSEEDFATYNQANSLVTNIKENVKITDEYKMVVANIADSKITSNSFNKLVAAEHRGDVTANKALRMFNAASYTPEQLKKAGWNGWETYSAGKYSNYKPLTFEQVAKLHGYESMQDAIDKGFNFGNVYIAGTSTTGGAVTEVEGVNLNRQSSVKDQLDYVTNQIYQKSTTKKEMSYNFINDKNLDKEMSRYFLGVSDLGSYLPAYSENWNNVPGFTEDGKLAPGTVLNISENRSPKIKIHGNTLLYEVPIKFDSDGNGSADSETTVVIKPKEGMNIKHDDLLYKLDAASGGNTALEKQTNSMIKAARFDSRFQGNNLSPQLIQSVGVTPLDEGGKSIELYSVPYDANSRLEVVKVQGKSGNNPVIKIAMIDANSGKRLGYCTNPTTGKDWYENAESNEAASSVKSFIMEILSPSR